MADLEQKPRLNSEKKKAILDYLEDSCEDFELFSMTYNSIINRFSPEFGRESLDNILEDMKDEDEVKEKTITASVCYPPSKSEKIEHELKKYNELRDTMLGLVFGGFLTVMLFNLDVFTEIFFSIFNNEDMSRPYLASMFTVLGTFFIGLASKQVWSKIQDIIPSIRKYSPILRNIGAVMVVYLSLILAVSLVSGITLDNPAVLAGLPTCVMAGYYLFKWKNDYLED